MMDLIDSVAALIQLAGGEVYGKTRLQKIAYLLEAKGIGLGLDFDYHNYGPFSAELAFAADDAESLDYIKIDTQPGDYAIPFTIFRSLEDAPRFEDPEDRRSKEQALEVIKPYSSLVLELAATAIYLRENGYPGTYWDEVSKRKASKARPDLLDKAKDLIEKLGL